MPAADAVTGEWAALFLPGNSPGQVIRFLQRRQRSLAASVATGSPLLVSDAAGPGRLRALIFEASAGDNRAYLDAAAPALSTAFAVGVTLLWSTPALSRWGTARWEPDATEIERTEADQPTPLPQSFFDRLRRRSTTSPLLDWARARNLPLDRLPPLRPAGTLPIIDYETIAALDRKSLLVENRPCLYRFVLIMPAMDAVSGV